MERERERIRELHQRHQESLNGLQALEAWSCQIGLGQQESTISGSGDRPPIPTVDPESITLPLVQEDVSSKSNIIPIDLSTGDDSDISESETAAVDDDDDDEDEHLSLGDLAKAAEHVEKLLRGITMLQQTFDGNRKTRRRVHKMYQRFCHKFESGMKASQRDSLPTLNDTCNTQPLDEYVILTSNSKELDLASRETEWSKSQFSSCMKLPPVEP